MIKKKNYEIKHNFKLLLLGLLVCISCKNRQLGDDPNTSTNDIVKVMEEKEEDIASSDEYFLDDKTKAVRFLKKNNIIKDIFPDSLALSYKSYSLDNFEYSLIKFDYDDRLGDFMTDPIINLLYVIKGNELITYQPIYSINEDDFTFKLKTGNNYFFEYYDSATGWKKLITYDTALSKFFETHKYDESDDIDTNSIDFIEKKYRLEGKSEVFNFNLIE